MRYYIYEYIAFWFSSSVECAGRYLEFYNTYYLHLVILGENLWAKNHMIVQGEVSFFYSDDRLFLHQEI